MNKKIWWALALAATLAGCSSVSLNDGQVPVEDRTAGPAGVQADPRAAAAVDPRAGAQSRVASVSADNTAGQVAGPAGVARLVYFDYDSVAIKAEFQGLIEGHARFLRANPARRIAIEGHTDERGGREYNLALGQRRAEAVRRALSLLGVADNQVEAVSFGKEKPAETGSDASAWAKNRRAEITYR
ncbi:MAG: putative peptidoglycan-associated lipoprotein precursor [Pseudomonadota bacterium]|jgi:peptidoglycan-associated lipoprotein